MGGGGGGCTDGDVSVKFCAVCMFQCVDFHIIEYNSRQWFPTQNGEELLNNRVSYHECVFV